jgi:N-acetylglucosaminyldiphosphoundecaprenol N-acetyl-beta-D-mannosaminyltransferase
MLAQSDDAFRSIVNMFTYKLPDGAGLVWGLKWLAGRQGRRLDLKRIAGADLALDLVKVCLENNKRVFLLGGKPGVAGMAARFLPLPFTKGEVRRGLIESYLGSVDIKNETEPERKNTLDRISAFKPALLLVAFGAPYQEKWIGKNRKELEQAGVKVAMVVGGTFDYWTGTVKRAPQWMQQAGLEWFWRLVLEPWRIKRQMALVRFVGLVMKSWK